MSWDKYIEWDRKYYMHHRYALEEWVPFTVAKIEGNWIIDHEGNRILDFMGGWFNINAGQRRQEILEEIKKALDEYGWVPETYVTSYKSEAARLIMEDLLGSDNWAGRVRFCVSGSEANEEAIIIARLYTNRRNILSRMAYHGWTCGSGSCTGHRANRNTLVSPKTSESRDVPGLPIDGFHFAPSPYCYRCPLGCEYPDCKENGNLACVQFTENIIKKIGAETFAAMVAEVHIGGPSIIPPPEYIPQIRKMTKDHGILWIDDEVICGFGRLGKWFGYQLYEGVTPDIITMAKGITSSSLPAAGVVVSKDIAEFFNQYRWNHYVTFGSHPVCMAAMVANIKLMIKEKIPERSAKMGRYLGEKLRDLEDRHKCVGLVNGSGLYWVVEIVKNKETREPFVKEDRNTTFAGDTSLYPNVIVSQKGLEKGVIIGGFVPNTLRIGPALNITEDEIDIGIEALDYAFTEIDKMC